MIFLPLLQIISYENQMNWPAIIVMVSIITIIAIILILYSRKSTTPRYGRKWNFDHKSFYSSGKAIGLNKNQLRILENIIRDYRVSNPDNLLWNSKEMKSTLNKVLRDINTMNASEQEIDDNKLEIYRIYQKIDKIVHESPEIANTVQLRPGQNVTLKTLRGERYKSIVTTNVKGFYCVTTPHKANGEIIRLPKGNKIHICIWGMENEEVIFESKILGYRNIKSINSMVLQHSSRQTKMLQRKNRRKFIQGECWIYPVQIVAEPMKGQPDFKRAIVDMDQGRRGSILDISIGGCSVSCDKLISKGKLIRITIKPQSGNSIMAFGKIVDSKAISRNRSKIHIQFTRTSIKNINRINSQVYTFQ